MAEERIAAILEAAYRCFIRYGVRRTTMDDIATEAGMSRPAVYQYLHGKDAVFRSLAASLYQNAQRAAELAAETPGDLSERLTAVLATKVEVVLRVYRESPHAAELLGENARLSADLDAVYVSHLRELIAGIVAEDEEIDLAASHLDAHGIADLTLALARGVEANSDDPELPHLLLSGGVDLIVRGLRPTKE